jgi:type VI secretion system secreted protein Hcp
MFLSVKGAAHGVINGESIDDKHKGEIEVLSWSWGIQGKASLGGGSASGKATIREMKIVKKVDKASTALMGAVRTNEVIKEAV